jgi:DNA-binding NarL/FixJ family response regulator
VLVLTGAGEPQQLRAALAAGAHGLLRKGDASEQLVSAIRTVLAGETYLSPQATEQIVANLGHALRSALTPRETEVLARVADGQSTKEIAFELGCSVKTIETHRANLMSKLGINNVASLTKYALRQGLTSL